MPDVIVIGGGPSGLMAAAAAGIHGASDVWLIEKGDKLGRKLAISGGGRCNVTNNKEMEQLIQNIPGNGRFMYSPFATFDNRDIARFFEDLGIRLKEEDNGRMFPVTDKASSVVSALIRKVREAGVTIRTHSPVQRILYEGQQVIGVQLVSGDIIQTQAVIVATGGKAVPRTGSTGDGYAWAREAGHTITELYPTEVPITANDSFIKDRSLQGLSLRDVGLSVVSAKGKTIVTHRGDMIFTHFGISGPIALRCSQFVVKELKKQPNPSTVRLYLDMIPDQSKTESRAKIISAASEEPKKAIKNVLKSLFPERIIPLILELSEVDGLKTFHDIANIEWDQLAGTIKQIPITATGTLTLEEAFVTGGGVHLKEIVPQTMESKLMSGLYFCGEILDIHGYTGGYNITVAFSTGYTAGLHAAEFAIKSH